MDALPPLSSLPRPPDTAFTHSLWLAHDCTHSNLHGTDSITDKTLHYLAEDGVCPELAELGLMANPVVTVAAVDALRLSRRITIVR